MHVWQLAAAAAPIATSSLMRSSISSLRYIDDSATPLADISRPRIDVNLGVGFEDPKPYD
jgi:hypothetical protein